jgi:hypothetical protein
LVNVARGDLRLVGLPPRTPEQVRKLPPDWRALYLRGRAGIISVTLLDVEQPSEEEVYAAEGAYAVAGGFLHDLGLLFRYALTVLRYPGGKQRLAARVDEPSRVRHPASNGEEKQTGLAFPAVGKSVPLQRKKKQTVIVHEETELLANRLSADEKQGSVNHRTRKKVVVDS